MTDRKLALDQAAHHAARWLDSLDTRPVPPQASVAQVAKELGSGLPDGPTPATEVIDLLARACEPGLTAMPSGRFFGLVTGGAHPAALAADVHLDRTRGQATSARGGRAGTARCRPAVPATFSSPKRTRRR